MTSLESLAAQVEAADGPSRELDVAIGALFELCAHNSRTFERCQGDSGYTCDACGADSWGNRNKAGQGLSDHIPQYTASLDAAMTLVGDHSWRVEDHELAGPCALVYDQEGYAVTPALALTAAALRARARSLVGEGEA